MTYFISGHRDITPEEFEKFYVPAIVDVIAIIKKLRDQRIDNAEQYRMAGRQDLYDNEMAESLILNEFLPEVPDDKVLALGLVEVCALQGCEDGPKIPKSKMGIIIKELKAMFPAADGKQIADLVKSCVV